MKLLRLTEADTEALIEFDLGVVNSPWRSEVAEIVKGLGAWESDPAAVALDRQVLVLDDDREIVAVAAHRRLQNPDGHVFATDRYLLVTACRTDRQRSGLARFLVDSIVAEMKRCGTHTLRWLVHPSNTASLAFCRRVFPDAHVGAFATAIITGTKTGQLARSGSASATSWIAAASSPERENSRAHAENSAS